ncbi:MAG: choice-of-anchor J domain-containing protein, partial [Crocinitomicaceae bacterium]
MNRILIALFLGATVNATAQTTIYSEDFQNGLPMSYTIVDNDMQTPDAATADFADAWIELVDPDNPMDTIVGSTSYFSPIGRADRWLITPPIALGAFGNILKWEAKSHDASYLDGYDVYISVTDTDLTSFIDTLGAVTFENATWTSREINLSEAGYNNQTVHIAFVNRTYDGFKLYLDDIEMVIEDPVGISENNLEGISVYPNPSTGFLNISHGYAAAITVRSMTGAKVY